MNGEQIMDALGYVGDVYILEAAPDRNQRKTARPRRRWLAAMIAVAALLVFSQTAPGAAAMELAKETAVTLLEKLFPPKDIAVNIEGDTETVLHTPGGYLSETSDGDVSAVPGFVIYYDTARYEMTEERGLTYLRPIPVCPEREEIFRENRALFEGLTEAETEEKIHEILAEWKARYDALPPCEMEISYLEDCLPECAAEDMRAEAAEEWERVSDVADSNAPTGYFFSVSSGEDWDAPCARIYFTDDGQGGVFQICVRYFQEAAEGHGARFLQMLRTFEVVAP